MKNKISSAVIKYAIIASLYSTGIGIWAGTIYLHMKKVGFNYSQINMFLVVFWIVTFIAELPSGVIADTFGRMRVVALSSVIRGLGLFILAIDHGSFSVLMVSAVLTAIGDSLYSGAPDSWLVSKLQKESGTEISKIISVISSITAVLSLVSGYIGANWLGRINLGLPLIWGAILLVMMTPIAMFIQRNEDATTVNMSEGNHLPNVLSLFEQLRETLITGLSEVRHNPVILGYLAAFLPIVLIVTGPYNQWQLYFPTSGHLVNTGNVLIGVNLMGIVGSFITQYLLPKSKVGQTIALMMLTFVNSLCVIFAVIMGKQLLAVVMFWMHVMVSSTDEVSRWTVLQTQIKSDSRSTIISLDNTLNAAVTVVALSLNGFISDRLGIGPSWIILGIIGAGLSICAYAAVLSRQIHAKHRGV